uniref:Uncharacterized protein n=1 Tax=Anguilla anguilla TaxID=7936 RepID=A0A0E9QZW3_ANGAN
MVSTSEPIRTAAETLSTQYSMHSYVLTTTKSLDPIPCSP